MSEQGSMCEHLVDSKSSEIVLDNINSFLSTKSTAQAYEQCQTRSFVAGSISESI